MAYPPNTYQPAIPFDQQTSPMRAAIGLAVAGRLAATGGMVRVDTDKAEIFLAPTFLSAQDCATLIRLTDAGCAPSKLFETENYEGFRTSQSCDLDRWNKQVKRIDTRIALLLGIDPRHGETVQGQRYQVGQRFKPHPDFFYVDQPYWPGAEKQGGQRTWTAMVYLNQPEGGGETVFPHLGIAIRPRTGSLLAWNNMGRDGAPNPWTMHEGSPVTAGTKYVVTKWFRERRWI